MLLQLAILIGKILIFVGGLIGKSTNLPGSIAMKICPTLLSDFQIKGKIIAVTGSNGKTTTANMIASIIKKCGFTLTSNSKGSNLSGGVATALIKGATISGVINSDYVVLEVDERFSQIVFKYITPHEIVITNLFRDQLTRNGNVDIIINKLVKSIPIDTKLILNANDSISSSLPILNERVYYGLDKTSRSTTNCPNITHDSKVCPKCFSKLIYNYYHYNHIGNYECSSCEYKIATPDFLAHSVDFDNGTYKIGEFDIKTTYCFPFHLLNCTAAFAACAEIGLNPSEVGAALSEFIISKLRFDSFKVGDRDAYMILSKNQNPVSFDQSIYTTKNYEGEKTIIIYVSNINHTDHKDTTWLYDVYFEKLVETPSIIICTGPRAYDLAVRLKLAGFSNDRIIIQTHIRKIKDELVNTKGSIFILTELYDARGIMEAIK